MWSEIVWKSEIYRLIYYVSALADNEVEVKVAVGDENDNGPAFVKSLYIAGVPADAAFDFPIITVKVSIWLPFCFFEFRY